MAPADYLQHCSRSSYIFLSSGWGSEIVLNGELCHGHPRNRFLELPYISAYTLYISCISLRRYAPVKWFFQPLHNRKIFAIASGQWTWWVWFVIKSKMNFNMLVLVNPSSRYVASAVSLSMVSTRTCDYTIISRAKWIRRINNCFTSVAKEGWQRATHGLSISADYEIGLLIFFFRYRLFVLWFINRFPSLMQCVGDIPVILPATLL